MIIGGIIRGFNADQDFRDLVSFDDNYFFNLLLPPIILNSGYDMHRQTFFKHFGTILIFAFAGTFISTIIIGILLYILSWIGIFGIEITFLQSVIVGSILSSTDPVTILSLFHQLKVDPKLYAIVFGESLLNDSVAIVLFTTLGSLSSHPTLTMGDLFGALVSFIAIFSGSLFIGVVSGLMCALILKYTRLDLYPSLETCIVLLQAYSSYLLSSALDFSGIVSLLFCGIIMKHYAYDNLSLNSKHTTREMFRVMSQLSENFVFIYLGMTLFTKEKLVFLPLLILFTILFIMVARYASVMPLAKLINFVHRWKNPEQDQDQIPENYQCMIWWAGLRGAIAFALSMKLEKGDAENTFALRALQTTILVVCVVSVIGLGGTTPFALKYLRIKTAMPLTENGMGEGGEMEQPEYFHLSGSQDNVGGRFDQLFETGDPDDFSMDFTGTGQRQSSTNNTHWFLSFDQMYLKPLFTRVEENGSFTSFGIGTPRYSLNRSMSLFSSSTNPSPMRTVAGDRHTYQNDYHDLQQR
jgi:sodium/hydrogen exchanger-like protein 6/7